MTQQSQLLGIYPEETKIEKDTCLPLFIAALFTIGRTWKQPRCPSTDEWIRKLWYIYTMEYYSAIKPNPGIEPRSPAMQADSLPSELPGKPRKVLSFSPFY